MQFSENRHPLPKEMPSGTKWRIHPRYRQSVSILVSNEHFSFYATVVERIHQSVGRHGSPTCPLTCIHNQYSHFFPINLVSTKLNEKDEKTRKKLKIFIVIAHNT